MKGPVSKQEKKVAVHSSNLVAMASNLYIHKPPRLEEVIQSMSGGDQLFIKILQYSAPEQQAQMSATMPAISDN